MESTPIHVLALEYKNALQPVHGQAEARAIIREVFGDCVAIPFPELAPDHLLSPSEVASLRSLLARILTGEPIQYVLGHVQFHGLRLAVDSRALIPRPETEELLQRMLDTLPFNPELIIDVATGSGCIALALKKAFPLAQVIGVDLSHEALALAASNGAATGLDVQWMQADALGPQLPLLLNQAMRGPHNLLVSNPPYVPIQDKADMSPQVLAHEPHMALFVEDTDPQIFFRAIAMAGFQAMHAGDVLWLEGHYIHAPETASLVREAGFPEVELLDDLSGNHRFIRARK